jgi:cytochrome P450
MSATSDLVSLADPAVLPDPYPVLAGLREASPFAAADGALVVTGRYRDCSAILRDPRASSARGTSLLSPPRVPPARSFLSMDPPDHTRLRGLVSKAFTPRVVAALAPRIRELAAELLAAAVPAEAVRSEDGDADRRVIEVVSQFAYPLPVRIISELLGVPPEDRPRFAGWSASLAHSVQPRFFARDPSADAAAQQARLEFSAYFRELIAARRARPAGDLLSDLIRAEDDGHHLTEEEVIGTCVLLLVAGHETTVSLISNTILALLRHPGQLAEVRADPGLAAAAVEETLRYDPPVQLTNRVAHGGLEVGELTVPDRGVVLLLLAASGRDPDVYPDPDRFDIHRQAAGHLAFAAGPHFCLGAPLARLEATIAVQEFAARLAEPGLDRAALSYKPNLNLRGPERLVVSVAGIRRPG